MEITEELYTVYKIRKDKIVRKAFDNFKDAYDFFKIDKNEYVRGRITHEYKVSEDFYEFDRTE